MVIIADINTIWRRKPFEELAKLNTVVGLSPVNIFQLNKIQTSKLSPNNYNSLKIIKSIMPPGWATKFKNYTAWRLWKLIKDLKYPPHSASPALVVTSPHYLPLIKKAHNTLRTYYYCSDDYSQYANWGGKSIIEQEREIVSQVQHSFFVSKSLAERAIHEYEVDPVQVSVCPNATEDGFLNPVHKDKLQSLLNQYSQLKRPIVGVVGAINDRLDFNLLEKCASLSNVGSLALIGPVDAELNNEAFRRLLTHPKCFIAGNVDHSSLPTWNRLFDVALIPYKHTTLNRFCSPMRLYDHMAAGKPIVATSACNQINELEHIVNIGHDVEETLYLIGQTCSFHQEISRESLMIAFASANTWQQRAGHLFKVISGISA